MLAKLTYLFLFFSLLPAQSAYNLYSPYMELPSIGDGETMHFGFYLHADIPDSDGDGDDYLDDYYSISINDITALAWHSSAQNVVDGNNFWCADEEVEGYLDNWIQYLDTPSISIGTGGELSAQIYFAIESPDDVEVADSCADGWDSANIRISTDGGVTWALLEDSSNPYHFDCGYGWIWNDDQYDTGGLLNHLAKGWGGNSNGWNDFSADLSAYIGEEIVIRFAFGSDPAWSTIDDNSLTGFQVDEIVVKDDSGVLFSDTGDDMSQMTSGGEVWIDQFYDYGSEEDFRPGTGGWEWYLPEMAFNGNVFMDISDFAEKTVQFRIQSRYDDNHDGGQGNGLFIDDFMIYKLFSGAYFPPWGLNAEAGSGEVVLTWEDMNASGTDDFIYDNGVFELENTLYMLSSAWVGEWFDVIGPSNINFIKIFNSLSNSDTTITVQAYSMYGSTFDVDPLYSMAVDVSLGWNEIPLNWEMNNPFIIAYEINGTFGGALDTTAFYNRSVINYGGTWKILSEVFEPSINSEFGLRANITYEGAGVTYNVYRDDTNIASGLTDSTYTDSNVENNVTYEYVVSATYSDGGESEESDAVSVTPIADSVHEDGYDDGTAEVWFNVEENAAMDNFSAVKFTASDSGEEIARFKWYQNGSGGAFYIKVFEDDDGMPGAETYSKTQASGNQDGWNEKDLSAEGLNVSGDFWVGVQEFSSSKSFGLDTDSNSGNSYKRIGEDGNWEAVEGNLMYRVYLDSGEGAGRVISSWDNKEEVSEEKYPVYTLKWENKKLRRVPLQMNGKQIYNQVNELGLLGRTSTATDTMFILEIYDFEDENTENWTHDTGWNLTTSDYNSPSHSFNSPNAEISDCTIGYDCAGICGGNAIFDECEVCNGVDIDGSGECDITCDDGNGIDCAGICNGNSIIENYFIDEDGDGLGFGEAHSFCNNIANQLLELGWVNNSEDEYPECLSNEVDICGVCDGMETDVENCLDINLNQFPFSFRICQIFPNPFNPIANIQFEVAEFSQVKLSIINLNGRLLSVLENGKMNPGQYQSLWDGNDSYGNQVSSGIYLAVFESNGMLIQTRKLILLK